MKVVGFDTKEGPHLKCRLNGMVMPKWSHSHAIF
jgi:hypothetical protein